MELNEINEINQNQNEINEINEINQNQNELNEINEINQNELNEIKEKEKEKEADFKGFFDNYFWFILVTIILICVIFFGSITLFIIKVASSNILPSDLEYMPYTNIIDENYKEIEQIINPIKIRSWFGLGIWDDPIQIYSQKASFDYNHFMNSFKKGWIHKLTKQASNPTHKLSNLALFMNETLLPLTASSFGIITYIFQILDYFPEWINMLFGALILLVASVIISGYNFIVSIFYHIFNFKQFFRSSTYGNPQLWEDESSISFLRIFKWISFGFIWFWIGLISTFVSPTFVTLYTLFKSLTAKYKLYKDDDKTRICSDL
jgi:hypothetical protein